MRITVPISAGELVDRVTILRIKARRLSGSRRLADVSRELQALETILSETLELDDELLGLTADLSVVNGELWDAVEALERLERIGDFSDRFARRSRDVLRLNDLRFAIKSALSVKYDSEILEQKSASVRSTAEASVTRDA